MAAASPDRHDAYLELLASFPRATSTAAIGFGSQLRYTAASLATAAIKSLQSMLGHDSAAMTLDRYGHLFGDELDAVADRMDAARADWMRTEGRSAPVRRLN